MSAPFQEFKVFCSKVGLDLQWVSPQSPKSLSEDNPSESPPAVHEIKQEKSNGSTDSYFDGFKNAQFWNVFKKKSSPDNPPEEGCSETNPGQVHNNTPETNANIMGCSNQDNFTTINGLLATSSVQRKDGNSAIATSCSHNNTCATVSRASTSHVNLLSRIGSLVPSSPTKPNNITAPSTAASTYTNNESVPSLASSVSTSSSVYSSWDSHHPASSTGAYTSLDPEAPRLKYSRAKDCRPIEANGSAVLFDISRKSTTDNLNCHKRSQNHCNLDTLLRESVITDAPPHEIAISSLTTRLQDAYCSRCSTAAFTESNSTVTTAIPSYMEEYLNKPRNCFEKTMGKYCPLFLRGTKNIDYDSCEFMFERKMIAVQYLLLDEHSEPRTYYNPSNKTVPFWKRLFNFDTMPSYDQLLDEAEHCFNSYQYRYEGFQKIEPYSMFCPWKNTQTEIDLVLDHIHFSLDVGRKRSLERRGNITLDTLDSEINHDIRIRPYQPFPSDNLVYEDLTHPAEQSLVVSPDASLIERAYQALVAICEKSSSPPNDFPTPNPSSAPQLSVPVPVSHTPCRLLLVRECCTATESETNKSFWFNLKRRNIKVTVPAPPPQCATKNLLQKWFLPLIHQ
ncbi:YNL034W [Saccharomyces arboricola H-6]|uniref:YNL034W n=1 Tax=Saccharomyces arboricola (strain H-6 / AS 2.3317 / CBS 10644) TaxID=1160507 RepID=J8PIH4_SACAR|nr:YNL034W [Saccharomyces arboricola H-6]